MRQVERDRDARHAVGREPLGRQPEVRLERAGRARRARAGARRCAPRARCPRWSRRAGTSQVEEPLVGPGRPFVRGMITGSGRADGVSGRSSLGIRSQCMRSRGCPRPARAAAGEPAGLQPLACGIPQRRLMAMPSIGALHEARVACVVAMSAAVVVTLTSGGSLSARLQLRSRPPARPDAPQPPAAPQPSRQAAAAGPKPEIPPRRSRTSRQVRGDGRRLRVADRGEADQRAGDDERDQPRDDRERADPELRRAAAQRCPGMNITQVSARDINVTSRGATGTLATGQLALLDGRSLYQDFFGFVMWDFLPGQPQRDQADRSDPRAGVGGVGRQRAQRRRQRDHQVAARDAGHQRDRSASAAFDRADGGATPARSGLLQRHARAGDQRSLVVQALGRRLLAGSAARGRPGTIPCDRAEVCAGRAGTYPAFTNQGTDAAEVRRPRRLRLRRTAASCRSRAARAAPTASCTPASARSTSTAAR